MNILYSHVCVCIYIYIYIYIYPEKEFDLDPFRAELRADRRIASPAKSGAGLRKAAPRNIYIYIYIYTYVIYIYIHTHTYT